MTSSNAEGVKELTREERFVRRLAAAHHAGGLGRLRLWHPGVIAPEVIALTGDATRGEFDAWALTGKAFALFHGSRRDVLYGYPKQGIGTWARRSAGDRTSVERIVNALCRAQDLHTIDRQLTGLARTPVTGRFAPHWVSVLGELTRWSDPATRADVAFDWARDLHTFTPTASTENA